MTISPLPGTAMYSLQFDLTVTNAGPNPGPAVAPGAFNFTSMLLKIQKDGSFLPLPPYMFVTQGTNAQPPNSFYYGSNWFQSLMFTNTSENLLGGGLVGTKGQYQSLQHRESGLDSILGGAQRYV